MNGGALGETEARGCPARWWQRQNGRKVQAPDCPFAATQYPFVSSFSLLSFLPSFLPSVCEPAHGVAAEDVDRDPPAAAAERAIQLGEGGGPQVARAAPLLRKNLIYGGQVCRAIRVARGKTRILDACRSLLAVAKPGSKGKWSSRGWGGMGWVRLGW